MLQLAMDLMMKRGDIYWVNLDPTVGSEIRKKRPCVIMSVNPINQARRTVVVVPLSTSATPREPIVMSVKCLGQDVVAVCDQIRTVDKSRLIDCVGSITFADLNKLESSLRQILGL